MMAYDTECSAVDRNLVEAVVSNCDIFMVARFLLWPILWRLFSTLVDVITSFTLWGTTEYVLMGFKVLLLLKIYSSTGSYSESFE